MVDKHKQLTVLYAPKKPYKKILFLGYDRKKTEIIDALINANCEVHYSRGVIEKVDYDLIICFGYREIIDVPTLGKIKCPIINLHISYLPYNRGSHPNFWSFFDKTPSGVTIHLIDEGIDTGPIIYQKIVNFDQNEKTFLKTYKKLIVEIEKLFLTNLSDILSGSWKSIPQKGEGTVHYINQLPSEFSGWDTDIEGELGKLRDLLGEKND